jgi:hypothetical protein
LGVVEHGFCWGFCEIDCAERGFLCGRRGEVVVICVAKRDGNMLAKNGTAFSHIREFIFRVADSRDILCESLRESK